MRIAGDVDQKIAQQPIDEPGRARVLERWKLPEGDLELVQRIVARLIDAWRLRGRSDEQTREQIGQRGMIVPIRNETAQQIGPSQEGRILETRTAQHEMVAAARPRMTTVEHEFLGAESGLARRFVQMRGSIDQLIPGGGRMNVHFDHTRIGRHAEIVQARIARRLVAFEHDRLRLRLRNRLDGSDELQVVLEPRDGRHENIEHAVAGFGAHRGTRDPVRRLARCRSAQDRLVTRPGLMPWGFRR